MANRNRKKNSALTSSTLSVAVVALCAVALFYVQKQKEYRLSVQRVAELEQQVLELKNELAKSKKQRRDAASYTASPSTASYLPFAATNSSARASKNRNYQKPEAPEQEGADEGESGEKKNRLSGRKFLVNHQLNELEDFMMLADDQRERLMIRFEAAAEIREKAFAEGRFDKESLEEELAQLEPIEDIIGPEMADDYKKHQEEKVEQFKEERLEQRMYSLSRKLTLNEEQEGKVLAALRTVNEETTNFMKELAEKRSEEEEPRAFDVSEMMERMKKVEEKRKESLGKNFKKILTDEQYNMYLELEATSPKFPFSFGSF